MKLKQILILFSFWTFSFSQAQIVDLGETSEWVQIGEWRAMGSTFAALSKKGDRYCLGFEDSKYSKISSWEQVCFDATIEDIDKLHCRILDAMVVEDHDNIQMKIGEETVLFKFPKKKRVVVEILLGGGANRYTSHPIRMKNWDRLFGKI